MTFLTGIIEGFYGRQWSWAERLQAAPFLLDNGLNSYLYCPKGDPILRKQWQQDWAAADRAQLEALARRYLEAGLNWGVGLSPYALYQDYSPARRARLQRKIADIDSLGGNLLAILFDDMPGDCPDLAARQAAIVADIRAWSCAETLLVCPTYYSHDPVLERFFGPRPDNYWHDLAQQLAPEIAVFWTGNEVCSRRICRADLDTIDPALAGRLCLWDNYPVNDGARASRFLHLDPLPERDPAMAQVLRGHFCNPMNQPQLSRWPLSGLGELYGGPHRGPEDFYSADMAHALREDAASFQQLGLDGIDEADREALLARYEAIADPAAAEVCGWLRGDYAFDPACLTG